MEPTDMQVGLSILARALRTTADTIDDQLEAIRDIPAEPDPPVVDPTEPGPPIVTDPTGDDGWTERPTDAEHMLA